MNMSASCCLYFSPQCEKETVNLTAHYIVGSLKERDRGTFCCITQSKQIPMDGQWIGIRLLDPCRNPLELSRLLYLSPLSSGLEEISPNGSM